MRMTAENYNAEVGHCPGARERVCTRCVRYALYDVWRKLPMSSAESVIMFAPKATREGCPNSIPITKQPVSDVPHRRGCRKADEQNFIGKQGSK